MKQQTKHAVISSSTNIKKLVQEKHRSQLEIATWFFFRLENHFKFSCDTISPPPPRVYVVPLFTYKTSRWLDDRLENYRCTTVWAVYYSERRRVAMIKWNTWDELLKRSVFGYCLSTQLLQDFRWIWVNSFTFIKL